MIVVPVSESVETARRQRVELSMAADAEMLFLARMAAAGVAARAQYDIEQVEDVRLAVDELCIALLRTGPGSRLAVVFEWDDDGTVDVSATLLPSGGTSSDGSVAPPLDPGADDELSRRILEALVDEHGEGMVGGARRAWFRVRRNLRPA